MLDELIRRLESITGDDPISIARRQALVAQINKLALEEDEKNEEH